MKDKYVDTGHIKYVKQAAVKSRSDGINLSEFKHGSLDRQQTEAFN